MGTELAVSWRLSLLQEHHGDKAEASFNSLTEGKRLSSSTGSIVWKGIEQPRDSTSNRVYDGVTLYAEMHPFLHTESMY